MQIWKQILPVDDAEHEIDGTVVHAEPGNKPDEVIVWFAHADGRKPKVYKVIGTGHEYDPRYSHVATVLVADGALVWHVMETRDTAYDV